MKKKKQNKKNKKHKDDCVGEITCAFSRLGGKCRIAKHIVPYFPEHKRYVEPFAGSLAVLLNKCESEEEIVSDLDDIIHQIWTLIKRVGSKFDARNQKNPYDFKTNKEKWNRFKKSLKTGTPVFRLYKAMYCMINSFSGSTQGWGGKKKKGGIYRRELAPYQKRLKKTKVLKQDYKKLIERFDSKDAFFYLDPPYDVATKAYYGRVVDLEEMRDLLLNMKGKFLLSIDITKNTKKLFLRQGFYTRRIKVLYTMGGNPRVVTEYLISNYPLKKKF